MSKVLLQDLYLNLKTGSLKNPSLETVVVVPYLLQLLTIYLLPKPRKILSIYLRNLFSSHIRNCCNLKKLVKLISESSHFMLGFQS